MKKQILLFLMVAFAFNTLNAAGLKVNDSNQPDSTVILFTATLHDFGTIKKDSDGSCDFTFKNTGKIPLVLSNVQSSCGCTIPSWPKEPIAPGKSGQIKVKYNTANIGGFDKSITVYSNARTIVLKIKGVVQE